LRKKLVVSLGCSAVIGFVETPPDAGRRGNSAR
jgi:hypothetical protein